MFWIQISEILTSMALLYPDPISGEVNDPHEVKLIWNFLLLYFSEFAGELEA